MLLGRSPKDFDISTDAQPSQIRKIFRNCFLIGRRFRLAHIVFGRKVIETSTFRAPPKAVKNKDGLYQSENNTFGTPEEDAKRRDFTINGLFYDIKTFSVIDYVGGLKDLERKVIRSIGDPNVRFREDPVRMMRAVKFAAKLDFSIEKSCRKAMKEHTQIF
jgi:poly(A) polymerase